MMISHGFPYSATRRQKSQKPEPGAERNARALQRPLLARLRGAQAHARFRRPVRLPLSVASPAGNKKHHETTAGRAALLPRSN